ncbi:MAG: flagellar protein FlaG [Lachnospiraceae bacterium]|nr:flagellar protein FlaG [Lachnospiraceae bacterium]
MAIEPLGSIMGLQTQTAMKPQNETKVQQLERTDAIGQNAAKQVDPTTVSVAQTQQKGSESQTRGEQEETAGSGYIQTVEQNQDKIKKAVEQLNKNMNNSEAIFGIHEGTNRVTIKIVDKDTKKVIKELPPEKTLDMIAKVWEMAGIMVDEKR